MRGGTAPCPCRRGSTDPACEPTSDGKVSRPRRTVPKHDSAGLHGAPHPCCGDGRPWTPRCASARHACGRSLPYQATVTVDVSCCRQGHHERVKSAAAKAPARENAALHHLLQVGLERRAIDWQAQGSGDLVSRTARVASRQDGGDRVDDTHAVPCLPCFCYHRKPPGDHRRAGGGGIGVPTARRAQRPTKEGTGIVRTLSCA